MAPSSIDESTLTKGQLRKLNALRKSVGPGIAERALAEWLSMQPGAVDTNAGAIADAVWPLVQQGKVMIPRGGYLIRRGRGRVVVERATP